MSSFIRPMTIGAALLALLLAAQPVAAATEIESFQPGVWSIRDDAAQPSVRCIYVQPDPLIVGLHKIKVWPPKVWGKLTATTVRWRFLINQQDPDFMDWSIVYTSRWQTRFATPTWRARGFTPMSWGRPPGDRSAWQFDLMHDILIEIEWLDAWSQLDGRVMLRLEYYREKLHGQPGGLIWTLPCPGRSGVVL